MERKVTTVAGLRVSYYSKEGLRKAQEIVAKLPEDQRDLVIQLGRPNVSVPRKKIVK